MSKGKLDYLRRISENVGTGALQPGNITQDALSRFGLVRASIGPGQVVGLRRPGLVALHSLADLFIKESVQYSRGTTFKELSDFLFGYAVEALASQTDQPPGPAELRAVDAAVSDWYASRAATRRLYVPCLLTHTASPAFGVGDVQFTHLEEFRKTQTAVAARDDFGRLFELMSQLDAHWIATVTVAACHESRAWELADRAVDVAIAALQLTVPRENSAKMARLYARTSPQRHILIAKEGRGFRASYLNRSPGLTLGSGALSYYLSAGRTVVDAVGRRLRVLTTGESSVPKLDQAWCDAAYWLHEGLAEVLETIAVAKLETAIEVLLTAQSSKGSRRRTIKAIGAFYGLGDRDPIRPDSDVIVSEFADRFVTERSRILHGTWSTLDSVLGASRETLESFLCDLLALYVTQLDRYAGGAGADDCDEFLEWSDQRRKEVAASRPA